MDVRFHGSPSDFGIRHYQIPDNLTNEQLIAERGRLDSEIAARDKQARADAEQAEHDRLDAAAHAARPAFDKLISEIRDQRRDFLRLFRETCTKLGEYCAGVDEATRLVNVVSANTATGSMPADRNALMEVAETPNPLAELLDDGFEPTTSFGWDWRLFVSPVRRKDGSK